MTKWFYRRFIPYANSCPFRGDNKCSSSCAFFRDCTDSGMCGLSRESANRTGYFTEKKKQP